MLAEEALVLRAPVGKAAVALAFVPGEGCIDLVKAPDCNLAGLDHARRPAASVEHDAATTRRQVDRLALGLVLRQGAAGGGLGARQNEREKLVRHLRGVAERELLQIAPGGRLSLIAHDRPFAAAAIAAGAQ